MKFIYLIVLTIVVAAAVTGCEKEVPVVKEVPHETAWGIYELDLETEEVRLVYGTGHALHTAPRLDAAGDTLYFAMETGTGGEESTEIFRLGTDGTGLTQLTDSPGMDVYPALSPDGTQIAFLSFRGDTLDVYIMDADGGSERLLYDSGGHDGDIDWASNTIVFTRDSAIWRMDPDGTNVQQVTSPPDQGEWGEANLPAGDYDPRFSPDGSRFVFERLENISIPHGGYNIFVINLDGTGETRLTDTGYSQGLANWSRDGEKLVYAVAAIGDTPAFDIHMMNSDGTDDRNITPDWFPDDFLCHRAIFSADGTSVYFTGQWWE